MPDHHATQTWRSLTPKQRTMLRRLSREGALHFIEPWEMRTVRSLLGRGLVRPRPPGRKASGLWFISAKGRRLLPRQASNASMAGMHPASSSPLTVAAEMPR